jgi:hypothetical protein
MSAAKVARRRLGVRPIKSAKGMSPAARQLQKAWPPHVGIQPLPQPYSPGSIGGAALGIRESSPLVMNVFGDHGAPKQPDPHNAVALAMEADRKPDLIYSVGDIVYYNGDPLEYGPQFFETYSHLNSPIVAIPGNHDGDGTDGIPGSGIGSFMANWCASKPGLPPGFEEFNRDVQIQPSHDWALALSAVTIIGVWTNVPSGGHLEPEQIAWLTAKLKGAPTDRPLIIMLHHPPYSIDAHHGGSKKMGDALDKAFTAANRIPDLVISGHVHTYERFTRVAWGRPITYLVTGNGGYHNLHRLAPGATPGQELVPGVTFENGDDSEYGYVKLTIDRGGVQGEYVGVTPGATSNTPPTVTGGKDTFSCPRTSPTRNSRRAVTRRLGKS